MNPIQDTPVTLCDHSRFNTRKNRGEKQIQTLAERIESNGFDQTRAPWAVEVESRYEIFAGGTRFEAAKMAGLDFIPLRIYEDIDDGEISRLADLDNENDEYHVPVSPVDVWAECWRLKSEERWKQQKIADAKGWPKSLVSERCGWHEKLPEQAKQACSAGTLDEQHIRQFSTIVLPVELSDWLTTTQAQEELIAEVLGKHRGSSVGIKPTVKVVREAAKKWKALIKAAEDGCESLNSEWVQPFVDRLDKSKARTIAAVSKALAQTMAENPDSPQAETDRLSELTSKADKLLHGDAKQLMHDAPKGIDLLLTDPPYGVAFQSGRRVTTDKKEEIEADGSIEDALDLLQNVLMTAHGKMAKDSTVLIFTGWRYEPEFRETIEASGFAVKGSIVWVKNNHGTGDLQGTFAPKHERIIHAVKGNPKMVKRIADVIDGKDKQNSEHPTEKPRDLLGKLIEAVTNEGAIVADPFMGTGNSMLEANRLKRDFWGCEIEEQWHSVAVDAMYSAEEGKQ